MNYENILSEHANGITTITINRPKKLNALNKDTIHELHEAFDEANNDRDTKVIILTGNGEKAFVAGADISEFAHFSINEGGKLAAQGQTLLFDFVENLSTPVIAAVNGFALGGGCELALSCDIRIANVKAKFGQPEVNLGMIPGYAGTQRLPRLVGLADALYLLTTGEMIGAEDALRIGLVQKVVEPEELMDEVMKIAKIIISKGPEAVKKVKYVTRNGYESTFEEGSELESKYFGSQFQAEGEEGMEAFLQKRKPNWQE